MLTELRAMRRAMRHVVVRINHTDKLFHLRTSLANQYTTCIIEGASTDTMCRFEVSLTIITPLAEAMHHLTGHAGGGSANTLQASGNG
jgi:hypothetical protein